MSLCEIEAQSDITLNYEAHMRPILSELQHKVQTAITSDPRTREYGIDVLEQNGVITLKGTVPTREVSDTAESLAAEVFGVRGVINELEVTTRGETNRR
jgi:osmotically-inducible protein OsmY